MDAEVAAATRWWQVPYGGSGALCDFRMGGPRDYLTAVTRQLRIRLVL